MTTRATFRSGGWALWWAVGCGGAAPPPDDAADSGGTEGGTATTGSGATSRSDSTAAGTRGQDLDSTESETAGSEGSATRGTGGSDGMGVDESGTTEGVGTTRGESSSGTEGSTGEDPLDCVDVAVGEMLGSELVVASVTGMGDRVSLPCSSIDAEDHITSFTAPFRGVFAFDVGDDAPTQTAFTVLAGDCDAQWLGCSESFLAWAGGGSSWIPPEPVTIALEAGQTVLVVVTTPSTDPFALSIIGTETSADYSCVDEDLGSNVGEDLASATPEAHGEVAVFAFTAPDTRTYVYRGGVAFLPGCAGPIEWTLDHPANLQMGVPGPGDPSGGFAVDLVEGQEIAFAIWTSDISPIELSIDPSSTPGGTCCTASTTAVGCSNAQIEACVCEVDGFCCGTNWDANCSGRAVHFCDANCME